MCLIIRVIHTVLNLQYAMEPNVFHLWPRGEYTMIALANKDCTFTVTLFAPFRVFDELLSTDALVEKFLRSLRTTFPTHSP